MSKNKKAQVKSEQTKEEVVVKKPEKNAKKTKVNDKKAKSNKKDPKEKGKVKRKIKETLSEFKKVTWPSFGEVCKRTGVVLVVVVVFAVIIFGIDAGLGALMNLITK